MKKKREQLVLKNITRFCVVVVVIVFSARRRITLKNFLLSGCPLAKGDMWLILILICRFHTRRYVGICTRERHLFSSATPFLPSTLMKLYTKPVNMYRVGSYKLGTPLIKTWLIFEVT